MDVRRYNVERSCLRCHERKVRCNKASPCDKCQRLNLPCHYPGPKRARRRTKADKTEMTTRLEQLEQSVAELTGQPPTPDQATSQQLTVQISSGVEDAKSSDASPSTAQPSTSVDEAQTHRGFLVKNGTYVDEPFLSRVLETEEELQSAMGSPADTNASSTRKPPSMKVDGIVTNPYLREMDFKSLVPDPWQATQLWETFLSRVDPVLKCIHIPSIKPHIFAAINRPESAPADVQCLLFAIFYGAATALAADDPQNQKLRADLKRYQQGIELAMYHSSFLDLPTVKSLQAMAIYLTCLRCHNSGRAGFTLRGLAMRAAQSIGLHRDGRHFKLSPLECELRRRLWWILLTTDARMAEDIGIKVSEHGYGGDTELPTNIDDANVEESTTEPVPSQPRWTEMSFILIIAEANKYLLPVSQATTSPYDNPRAQQILTNLKNTLHEKFIQHGDFDIPIQRMGMILSQILLTKIEFHLRHKELGIQVVTLSKNPVNTEATKELLRMAVKSLKLGLQMYEDELLRGFRWLSSTYTQFHLLTYILWHLCVHPADPHAEEAWGSVNHHFDLVERDPSWPDPGDKWGMLVKLRSKAARIRNKAVAAHQAAQRTQSAGPSDLVPISTQQETLRAQSMVPRGPDMSMAFMDGPISNPDAPGLDVDDLDLNWAEFFPDWNYLAESMTFMGQGMGQDFT